MCILDIEWSKTPSSIINLYQLEQRTANTYTCLRGSFDLV